MGKLYKKKNSDFIQFRSEVFPPKTMFLSWKGVSVKNKKVAIIIVLGIVDIIIMVVLIITVPQTLDINGIAIRMDVCGGLLKEQFITLSTLEL